MSWNNVWQGYVGKAEEVATAYISLARYAIAQDTLIHFYTNTLIYLHRIHLLYFYTNTLVYHLHAIIITTHTAIYITQLIYHTAYISHARHQYTDAHSFYIAHLIYSILPYCSHYTFTACTILTPVLLYCLHYMHYPHSYRADIPTFQIPDTHVIQMPKIRGKL